MQNWHALSDNSHEDETQRLHSHVPSLISPILAKGNVSPCARVNAIPGPNWLPRCAWGKGCQSGGFDIRRYKSSMTCQVYRRGGHLSIRSQNQIVGIVCSRGLLHANLIQRRTALASVPLLETDIPTAYLEVVAAMIPGAV